MAVKFNPFTGQLQLDQVGAGGGGGGGSSYLDGEVATYNDLFLDGTAAINSAWLVREASGTWLIGRKPAGIYIRTATGGTSRDADYTYAGILPDVFNDNNFLLYDNADSTKNLQFQLSGISSGTTRTLTAPNASGTIALTSDITSGLTDGDKGDITVSSSGATWTIDNDAVTNAKLANVATATIKGRATAGTGDPEDLTASQVRTILNVADGATANTASTTTPAALGTAAAGTATNYAREDHIHAMPSAADVGAAAATHASSHATGGSDPLAPSDIGAQSIFVTEDLGTVTANVTLTAARAKIYLVNSQTSGLSINLPTTSIMAGDVVQIRFTSFSGETIAVRRNGSFYGSSLINGQQATYIAASTSANSWEEAANNRHSHGNITNEGRIGTTSGLPVQTSGGGLVSVGAFGTSAGQFAEGDHGHGNLTFDGKLGSTAGLPVVTTTAGAVTTLALGTAGQVLTVNSGANGVEFAAASGGGVTAVGASTADVLSVSGSDLIADDGGTIDSADPFIKWDDAAGKLVYANPLSRPAGAMYVGIAPTTSALGTDALCLQSTRSNAICVPSGTGAIAIGRGARATGTSSLAIGPATTRADALDTEAIAIGANASANSNASTAVGKSATANAVNASAFGAEAGPTLRGGFSTRTFNTIYWGGQTTNDTATVLNLDGTATNRFTIAANTALAVDILLVARRSDTADKWLVARRFLGIRRDGSNNTSLIGTVQEVAPDQSAGSPTWTYSLTADTTNHALQLEVVGANSETVQWRATAFYRVV